MTKIATSAGKIAAYIGGKECGTKNDAIAISHYDYLNTVPSACLSSVLTV